MKPLVSAPCVHTCGHANTICEGVRAHAQARVSTHSHTAVSTHSHTGVSTHSHTHTQTPREHTVCGRVAEVAETPERPPSRCQGLEPHGSVAPRLAGLCSAGVLCSPGPARRCLWSLPTVPGSERLQRLWERAVPKGPGDIQPLPVKGMIVFVTCYQ